MIIKGILIYAISGALAAFIGLAGGVEWGTAPAGTLAFASIFLSTILLGLFAAEGEK